MELHSIHLTYIYQAPYSSLGLEFTAVNMVFIKCLGLLGFIRLQGTEIGSFR